MKWQVQVRPEAEEELVELFLTAQHRGVVTAAWEDLEAFLRTAPTTMSRAVDFANLDEALTLKILHRLLAIGARNHSVWVIHRSPLRAFFTIHPDDMLIKVWLIRSSSD